MADEIDMANEMADLHLKNALLNVRAQPKLPPKGVCYYCDSKVNEQQLYCNKDCADDHEKELRIRNRR